VSETCGVVKTKYELCSKLTPDAPTLRMAFTLEDEVPPQAPLKLPDISVLRDRDTLACQAIKQSLGALFIGCPMSKPSSYDAYANNVTLKNSPSPDIAYYRVYRSLLNRQDELRFKSDAWRNDPQNIIAQARVQRDANGKPLKCTSFSLAGVTFPFVSPLPGSATPAVLVVPVDRAGVANYTAPLLLRLDGYSLLPNIDYYGIPPYPEDLPANSFTDLTDRYERHLESNCR
jgi:hypothetical protein